MHLVFHVIGWLLFGLIVGAVARFVMPGRQPMSWFMTAVLGVAGSFVGGAISWLLFGTPNNTVNPAGWIMSIVGAALVILISQSLNRGRTV
jgi:uncharacterized membrane protein YeaQ/YmgE (transglycosylase-associated protein family)